MTLEQYKAEIERLQKKMYEKFPYSKLNDMKNKEFGEWSETLIAEKVTGLVRDNGMGKDLFSEKLGKIEVKSTRNPNKFTFNQIKPQYSDYHIFICYHVDDSKEDIFLVPNTDLSKFSKSAQHSYDEHCCFTLSSTKANVALLENYRVTWEKLEEVM